MYYVVHKGKKTGIYNSWPECKAQINNMKDAVFKKFVDLDEAKLFLKEGFGDKKPKIVKRRENEDLKNENCIKEEMEEDDGNTIFIYTDGSYTKFKGGAKAGYGIYIPTLNIKVSKPLINQKITNNRAELTAIIESIKYLDEDDLSKRICILTDSQYSMYIFGGTGERYEKNGYKNDGKDVPNIDLIKMILEMKRKYNIVLLKVRAHTDKKDIHSEGNKIADKLANDGSNSGQNSGQNSFFKDRDDALDDSLDDSLNDSLEEYFKPKKSIFFKNKKDEEDDIDENVQMNDLFEFSPAPDNVFVPFKPIKNAKLTKWFIKSKNDFDV
jgi:ribonuclease HI